MPEFNALILAAGKSKRFGRDKAFLKLSVNSTFIAHLIEEFNQIGAAEIIVVANEQNIKSLQDALVDLNDIFTISVNKSQPSTRFSSLVKGLSSFNYERPCFVQNVDNPYLFPDLIMNMFNSLCENDYVRPICNSKGGHPILLAGNIIEDICSYPDNQVNFKSFLPTYKGKDVVTEETGVLLNINSPADYKEWFERFIR